MGRISSQRQELVAGAAAVRSSNSSAMSQAIYGKAEQDIPNESSAIQRWSPVNQGSFTRCRASPDVHDQTAVNQPPNIQADGTADSIPSILTAKPWIGAGDSGFWLGTGLTASRVLETDIFALTRPAVLS